ncbi:MAG TPA: S8 family serine peptidase [Allosphingosinicella sp.]|nr:S8 family serine peptidase [Allosphingosinicella sp.]
MMLETVDKLDAGLQIALEAWHEAGGDGGAPHGIGITLRFTGDLAAIEALGFETHSVRADEEGNEGENEARGVVRFKDVPAIAAHAGVRWMAAGMPRSADLNTAVPDIQARASTAATAIPTGDGVWHVAPTGGIITQIGNATGAGVIIAIIDTGIDYTHPMFMSQLIPTKVTRILRIWDHGLVPTAAAQCPDKALFDGAETYGVQYDSGQINTAVNGGAALRHRDCDGHGTHVAGIAAGGRLFAPGGDTSIMGVAPEAEILVVKLLDNPGTVNYFTGPPNTAVGFDDQFRHAVLYCLRVAKLPPNPKPVVINISLGSPGEAGDGLDADSVWVDQLMDPAQPAGPNHFPTGAVIVKSAGNNGSPGQGARIVVPPGGSIVVPLVLRDTRGPLHTKPRQCQNPPTLFSPDVQVHFWYRRATPASAVKFAMRLPDSATFSADAEVGQTRETGFRPRPGPPPTELVAASPAVQRARLTHEDTPAATHPTGPTTVRRQHAIFRVRPRVSGTTATYFPGVYEIRITAPAGTIIHALCQPEGWGPGHVVTFRIGTALQDGTAINPAQIDITPHFSAVTTLGRHAITVAAYNDNDGVKTVGSNYRKVAVFSSRGPLRNFGDPPLLPLADKPDIAAPGVSIDSAASRDTHRVMGPPSPDWLAGRRFLNLQGTSMATPMVAGVVALLLDKNPSLSTTLVRSLLGGVAEDGVDPPPASGTAHTFAFGQGIVNARLSHVAVSP